MEYQERSSGGSSVKAVWYHGTLAAIISQIPVFSLFTTALTMSSAFSTLCQTVTRSSEFDCICIWRSGTYCRWNFWMFKASLKFVLEFFLYRWIEFFPFFQCYREKFQCIPHPCQPRLPEGSRIDGMILFGSVLCLQDSLHAPCMVCI